MQKITDIDKQLIQLFHQRIEISYQTSKEYLLNVDNYTLDVDESIKITTVRKLINFIEEVLQKSINRFTVLQILINYKGHPLLSMYLFPFSLLKKTVLEEINQLFLESNNLACGFEYSGLYPTNTLLFNEEN